MRTCLAETLAPCSIARVRTGVLGGGCRRSCGRAEDWGRRRGMRLVGMCALLLLARLEPGTTPALLSKVAARRNFSQCCPQCDRRTQPASTRCFCSTHGTGSKKSNARRATAVATAQCHSCTAHQLTSCLAAPAQWRLERLGGDVATA